MIKPNQKIKKQNDVRQNNHINIEKNKLITNNVSMTMNQNIQKSSKNKVALNYISNFRNDEIKTQLSKNNPSLPFVQQHTQTDALPNTKLAKKPLKRSLNNDQQQRQGLHRQIKWFCPCGQKMLGPLHFFQHIKMQHQHDTLQKVIRQQTVKSFIRHYPDNHPKEFQIVQSLEDNNFQNQIKKMTEKYKESDFNCSDTVPIPQHRGTYADLAHKFVQQFSKQRIQLLLLIQFFDFLHHFIQRRFGRDCWQQQSPKDILKVANHIYHYFRAVSRLSKEQFGPLKVEDVKRLIHMLAKWMFINKWTNDRLIDSYNDPSEKQDIQSTPIQTAQQNHQKSIFQLENNERIHSPQKQNTQNKDISSNA